MIEELIRHELPIQSIMDQDYAYHAIVPIHLVVLSLPDLEKVDISILKDARATVPKWFNEDMEYLLDVLGDRRKEIIPSLDGYERFQDDWHLDFIPGKAGFVTLSWTEKNARHLMQYIRFPICIYNQTDDKGEFHTYQKSKADRGAEVIFRESDSAEVVYFTPEKMIQYGNRSSLMPFDIRLGEIEVSSKCFGSYSTRNYAHALLLRDFGVFYLNRLLEVAQGKMVGGKS